MSECSQCGAQMQEGQDWCLQCGAPHPKSLTGGGPGWRDFLFVDNMTSLPVVIPIFAVIGLVGLFIARAWPYGSFHNAGLGLFVVSGVIIFLDIKRVFDRMNSHLR